ncbi:MAG: ribonuclease Z [Acidimicrobiales bacterium]
MPAIEVVLLGTGSPIPDPNRAGPATLVRAAGRSLLIDCGRGVLMRTAAIGLGPNQLRATLLTHLHSDHLTDLTDVITTRWVTSFAPLPLEVFGPPGTQQVVDGILASLAPDISYRLAHHADLNWEPSVTVTELTAGTVMDEDGLVVTAAPTDHRPVAPTVGFRFDAGGHSVVVSGDTVPCEGLDQLCRGADVLVCTVIRKDMLRAIGLPRLVDVCDYHSSVEQAADTAQRAGVGRLVLTHCVPPVAEGAEEEWTALAAGIFSGEVVVASDLERVEVG